MKVGDNYILFLCFRINIIRLTHLKLMNYNLFYSQNNVKCKVQFYFINQTVRLSRREEYNHNYSINLMSLLIHINQDYIYHK